MTTNIVQSITDEQLEEIEQNVYMATSADVIAIITRLREAEADARRWRYVVPSLMRSNGISSKEECDAIADAAMKGQHP